MTINERPRVLVLEGLSGTSEHIYRAGGDPITASPRDLADCEQAYLEGAVDALVLTGGGDVDPRLYGQRPSKHVYGVNETRDQVELAAVRLARAEGLPVLGICRGAQLMNVEAGGTLHQDLPSLVGGGAKVRHRHGQLPVHPTPGSLISVALGVRQATVTHLHHQAVDKVGANYRASAWHRDGTIEAIESTDGTWRIGVQFHPEYASGSAPELGLFRQLVLQAALLAGLTVPKVRRPARAKPAAVAAPAKSAKVSAATFFGAYNNPSGGFCYRCRVRFDDWLDYAEHMDQLHHVDVLSKL